MANQKINGGASPYPKHVGPSAICSFSDGADGAPLKSLVFAIEPSQDLHGYDYPWPAGGGVNIQPDIPDGTYESNGITFAASNGTITISGKNETASNIYWRINLPTGVTFPALAYAQLHNPAANSSVGMAWLNSGTQKAYMSCNAADRVFSPTGFSSSQTINQVQFFVTPGGDITNFKLTPIVTATSTPVAYAPYSNISPITGWSQVDGKQSGADMSDYTPITIALGQTVYGGYADALSGNGVSELIDLDMATITDWNIDKNAKRIYKVLSSIAPASASSVVADGLRCNRFASITANQIYANVDGVAISTGSALQFRINGLTDDPNVTLAAVNTYFANNSTHVVCKVASPTTLSLTPVSVSTLLGQNNIWANTGDTELDYYPAQSSVVAVWDRTRHMYVSIPLSAIRYDTYQINPQQAIDLDSYRSETGTLIRNVVGSKAKIEFNTPMMDDSQWAEVWSILSAGFNNANEKRLKLKYYDTQSGSYKYGYFYVPDVQTPIRSIDEPNGIINYNEIRLAFIEY